MTNSGHAGILQDVSTGGALLLSRVELMQGDAVVVRFRAEGADSELVERHAKVVRSEAHTAESIWPVKSALEFDRSVAIDIDALSD